MMRDLEGRFMSDPGESMTVEEFLAWKEGKLELDEKPNLDEGIDWLHGSYEELQHAIITGQDRGLNDDDKDENLNDPRFWPNREQSRRQMEMRLLDVENFEDFVAAREALPKLVFEPWAELDEMTSADYRNTRQRDQQSLRPEIRPGEVSVEEFISARNERNRTDSMEDYIANRERTREMLNGVDKR